MLLERELNNYEFQFDLLTQRLEQMEDVMTEIENRDNEIYRAYFEASPIPEEQRRAGFGGVNRYKKLEGFGNSDQIIETTKQIDILSRMLVVQSKSLEEIQQLAEKKEELLAAIPSIQPIKKEDLNAWLLAMGGVLILLLKNEEDIKEWISLPIEVPPFMQQEMV